MAIKLGGLELATPGDIIVGGGAYAAGFAIDAFFFSGGATSSTTAGACAIGALSVKYGIQSLFGGKSSPPKSAEEPQDNPPPPKRNPRKLPRSRGK